MEQCKGQVLVGRIGYKTLQDQTGRRKSRNLEWDTEARNAAEKHFKSHNLKCLKMCFSLTTTLTNKVYITDSTWNNKYVTKESLVLNSKRQQKFEHINQEEQVKKTRRHTKPALFFEMHLVWTPASYKPFFHNKILPNTE